MTPIDLSQSIAIAGGGIGGLTAALSLARLGRRVAVIEQAPVLQEIGAGIQMGPNAFKVFGMLGLRGAAGQGRGLSGSLSDQRCPDGRIHHSHPLWPDEHRTLPAIPTA